LYSSSGIASKRKFLIGLPPMSVLMQHRVLIVARRPAKSRSGLGGGKTGAELPA
jgi:hypothetical protein